MQILARVMLCCFPPQPQEPQAAILDVQKTLEDYVWNDFLGSLSVIYRKFASLQRSRFKIEVPMNYYHFEEYKPPNVTSREVKTEDSSPDGKQKADHSETNKSTKLDDSKKKHDALLQKMPRENQKKDSSISALMTSYVNNTAEQQTYKFKMEKTRKSSVSVSLQKGFSLGGNTNLCMSGVGSGLGMSLQVTQTQNDVTEETVKFETNSEIVVPARTRVTAKVILDETQVNSDFKAWTKLSLPSGEAWATVRRGKRLCHSLVISRLDKVFKDLKNVKVESTLLPCDGETFERRYHVVLMSSGVMAGVKLRDQDIFLQEEPLPPAVKS